MGTPDYYKIHNDQVVSKIQKQCYVECIDIIALLTSDLKGSQAFHLGNTIKYLFRMGKKDKDKTTQDIDKAIHYLEKLRNEL